LCWIGANPAATRAGDATVTTIPTLELRGVDKSFGPVHVLSSVDFTANAGR